jgi:hypothetical protein
MYLEPVANAVLATVDMDDILHARLDPWYVGRISSISSHD